MNTKQMTYLIETAKTMNLSRAAENLFISQPSLSYQIKAIEDEVGFPIFNRIGKSIRLTPAGQQLITSLERVQIDLKNAIEQAQNIQGQYQDSLTISFSTRTALRLLPDAIQRFETEAPGIQIVPQILPPSEGIANLFRGETDILLLPDYEMEKLSNLTAYPIYTCHIYLLCLPDDSLATKSSVSAADLKERTLLVNGGSSKRLQQVQQQVIATVPIQQLNSPTHDFTLIQVASRKAVCLSPGIYQDGDPNFKWIPFECEENFPYYLCIRENDTRPTTQALVKLLQELYQHSTFAI